MECDEFAFWECTLEWEQMYFVTERGQQHISFLDGIDYSKFWNGDVYKVVFDKKNFKIILTKEYMNSKCV